ncbi:MAG: HYR domain-containing protein, partial [Vicingaceae bacterium]|nr:HYR domain-containing protein [Vicingaceae bacterium]
TVIDNIDPTIIACGAGNQIIPADSGVCTYTHVDSTWDATATDNCTIGTILADLSGATTASGLTTLNGVTFNPGITTVLWTITDTVGNSVSCTYTVEVVDTEAPLIFNCVADTTVSNDSTMCGAIVNWTPPTYTDNCGASMTSTHNPGDFFNVGTTGVTYTVTDSAGNVSTCSFNVNVNDTELPIITCPAPIATCDSLVNYNAPVTSDNCGVDTLIQLTGLPSGSIFPVGTTTNTFEVKDIHGNVMQCSFDVIIHPTPMISSVSTDISCYGFNDGIIDITVTNGTPSYSYLWSNLDTTEDVSNLAPGIYSVTVTDTNGCIATVQDTISQPDTLVVTATDTNITCFGGNDGAINITVTGGIPVYSYSWSNSAITEDISNLTAGFYQVTVTDSNGCTANYSTTLTQPDSIAISTISFNATCTAPNGSIQAQIMGGVMPYDYLWSNGDTTVNLNNVISGTYTIVVTDANGCVMQATDSISSESNLVAELITEDVSCYGDSDGGIRVTFSSGNPPYMFNWSTGDTTTTITGLVIGDYYVLITDSFGCKDSLNATIYQPDSLILDLYPSEYFSGYNVSTYGGNDGYINSSVFGGVFPYDYIWSNGATMPNIEDLIAGEYTLIVTDSNGCIARASVELTQPYILEMPTGYSPNYDGSNDFFVIRGVEGYPDNKITVFNRWGNIVYEAEGYQNEWDGKNMDSNDLPDGTYFVIFTAFSDEDITLKGYVEIRR